MRKAENMKSGFRGAGIHSFNPEHVLKKVKVKETAPETLPLDNTVVKYLKDRREAVIAATPKRARKVTVVPGQGTNLSTFLYFSGLHEVPTYVP